MHCKVQVRPITLSCVYSLSVPAQISNQGPDLHSGVDGGPVSEPMMDMYAPDADHLLRFCSYFVGSNSLAPSPIPTSVSRYPNSVRTISSIRAHTLMILPDNAVRPLTEEERQLYKVLSGVIQTPASVLSAKWREPSLTIHDVRASSATSEFTLTLNPFRRR